MSQRLVLALTLVLVCLLAFAAPLFAQNGDKENEAQPEVWKTMTVPPAPVLTPQQEFETFKIAPGFRIELVAAEPLVEDPIAMDIDAAGRLWVVEMRGFMPNVDGKGEDAPVGRIVVLEDTDADGRMDRSTPFLDGLVMPRAVAVVEGGVLVAEPPNLWFCRDTNGDLKCDDKQVVFDNYGQQGPVEHTDNGLMHGMDNWLYSAKSSLRFRLDNGKLTVEPTAFRGQWGITQDDFGRIYTNSNSSYLHADLVPAHYLSRNPHFETDAGVSEKIVTDQSVHSIRVNPGVNRGYQDRTLRDDGRLANTTATCGPVIYRGDQFPSMYRGWAFIPEPSGNVISLFSIEEDGVDLTTKQKTYPDPRYGKRAFLASTDERFRPVNMYNAPDGSLYVVDMYRGILQHKVYVTSFLRKQIVERGLDKPLGLGRIWRIVYQGKQPRFDPPRLGEATSAELVKLLEHENGWHRDMAQRLLVERGDETVVPALRKLVTGGDTPAMRVQALATLMGLGGVDEATALAAAEDGDHHVRIMGLRAAELLRDRPAVQAAFIEAARDEDPGVRLQAMFSLGELTGHDGAEDAMVELLSREPENMLLRHAAISGLAGRELAFMKMLLAESAWAKQSKGRAAALKDLSTAVFRSRDAADAAELLSIIAKLPAKQNWRQLAMLDGVIASAKNPRPLLLRVQPAALAALQKSLNEDVRERGAKVEAYVTWPGDDRAPAAVAQTKPLTPEQQARFEHGKMMYMATCMGCHQPHGKGQEGVAPPLVDSPWVLGPDERLSRIVLTGLMGPIEVDGKKWELVMPGLRDNPLMTDETVAAILTYVRREWGHAADPVEPATVAKVRQATQGRYMPFTAAELEQIK